jgi:tetratricopeptide (TPR) repeat protein
MEDNIIPETYGQCIQCKEKPFLEGYPMQLCTDCRNTFNKYPIPTWIWAFAGGILLLMVISFIRVPKFLDAAIHLRRAEKAVEDHRYVTAGREADKVLAKFPDLIDANGYKLISTIYSPEYWSGDQYYEKLKDQKIENKTLLDDLNTALERKAQFYPEDTSLPVKVITFTGNPATYTDSLMDYTINDQALFGYLLANHAFSEKDYAACIAIAEKGLKVAPDNYLLKQMLIAAKRQSGDYKGALADCDELLDLNNEDLAIIDQKCKVYLKQKKDQEAMALAKKAMAIDPESVYTLEAMSMAEYFAGSKPAGMKLLARIRTLEQAENDSSITERLTGMFNGTETFR